MAVYVNLLPDSKLEKIKVEKAKGLAVAAAVVIIALSISVPAALFAYIQGQRIFINTTQQSIDGHIETIRGTENIENILTVQNQLESLPGLYGQRHFYGQLFNTLPSAIPRSVRFSILEIDSAGQLVMQGRSGSFADVQVLIEALERLEYSPDGVDAENSKLFTEVMLETANPDLDGGVDFTVASSFDVEVLR